MLDQHHALFHPREAPAASPLYHVSLAAALSTESRNLGGGAQIYPQRVPTKQSEGASFKTLNSLEGAVLSRKKMPQVSERWLRAENWKSLEKGKVKRNEHLLCIYYVQVLGWIIM